jgi:biotin transport system substrate-specific component
MQITLKKYFLPSYIRFIKISFFGLVIMWVASWICVAKVPVPVTLQPMGVQIIGLLMSPGQAALAMGSWIVAGALGLPCYALGESGLGSLMGVTCGYFIGMLAAAPLMSFILNWVRNTWGAHYARSLSCLVATGMVGMMLVLACGWLFAGCWLGSLETAWSVGVKPFFYADTVKVVLSALLIKGLGLRRNDQGD